VYWRRRIVALALGLCVLTAGTWAAAGLVRKALAGKPAALSADRQRAGGSTLSSEQSASAGIAGGHPRPMSPTVGSSGPGGAGRADGVGSVVLGRAQPSCPAGDVVLTVFASEASYSSWQQPQFTVDVVSTASFACSFDTGAAHVMLRIAAGSTQVWTSGQCAEAQASQPVTLRRGVPTVVTMTWDGQYSAPGCPRPGRTAPAGSYAATASDGSSSSNAVGFQIESSSGS
jgi:hypothetical protein